jgi:hypothetical protein
MEVPVLMGSPEVQEHGWAHALRWPSRESTTIHMNLLVVPRFVLVFLHFHLHSHTLLNTYITCTWQTTNW